MNIRAKIKNSDSGIYKIFKQLYYFVRHFNIPAPKILWKPVWILVLTIIKVFHWSVATLWVTPLYKAFCEKVGKNFKAGTFLPFVVGKGRIFIGNNVMINGKIDFIFGSILKEIPEIHIADNCNMGHNVTFAISGRLEIGFHCLIASNITFQDCSGHSIDPDERGQGKPPQPKDVRPIKIGSNVWIGDGVTILPGAIIGDNCVIAANTIVNRNVPDGVLVYTAPAQMVKIRKIAKMI